MTLAFMSVSVLLLALCVRTSSYVNKTLCVGRAHFLCAFTHLLGIYIWTTFKRHVFERTFHRCCSILDVRS